jgi:subtilisin family serine protease
LHLGIRSVVLLATFAICPQLHAVPGYREGHLLVKWQDGPESYAAAVGNDQIGSTVKRNFNTIGWQHVQLPSGMSVRDGIKAYRALGTVLAVEPDGIIEPILPPVGRDVPSAPGEGDDAAPVDGAVGTPRPTIRRHGPDPPPPPPVVPNDPMFSQQWNLKKIGATNAWATTTGSTNVIVAVIDTGVDYTHPDLAANMWRNPGETGLDANGNDKATNGIDDDGNGYVDDVHGINSTFAGTGDPMEPSNITFHHGTACAGVIGAVGNNQQGGSGINWQVGILAVSVANPIFANGSSENLRSYIAGWIAAVDYVIAMKRRGVNIVAINGSVTFIQYSEAFKDALNAAGAEGILNIFIAGNNTVNNDVITLYPSGYNLPSVIIVASSDSNDALVSYSSYGRSSVHLAAPGVNILSPAKGSGYTTWEGTSAAGPHVTGAIALLAASAPQSTAAERKAAILGSVDRVPALRDRVLTGGRLNVGRAMQQLTNLNAAPIVLSATPANSRTRPSDRILLHFNRAMDRASVENGFRLTPVIAGRFQWSEGDCVVEFLLDNPLVPTNYVALLSGAVTDTTGATLDGNYNGANELSPTDDFRWTFSFPVPNDDFANAQAISDPSGSVTGTTRNATPELEEPDHAGDVGSNSSVWYRWIASASGWVTFDVGNAAYDTLLAVYTGTNLLELVEKASNDNYGSRQTSRLSFQASTGTTYSIALTGKGVEGVKSLINESFTGPFKLTWYPTPSPGFTSTQFFPTGGVPGTKVTLTGTNFAGATAVLFNGANASFTNAPTNNFDLRITAVVPPDAISGPITIVTPHASVTSTASFQVPPPKLAFTFNAANGLEFKWPSTSTAWMLEAAGDLSKGVWTPLAGTFLMTNGETKVTLPSPAGNRFYRLKRN